MAWTKTVSFECQEALDAYCNVPSHCLSHVSFKGPLHALRAGDKDGGSTAAWRCYGETSLDSTNTRYTSGGDYCTKNAELAAINDAAPCNGTVPVGPLSAFKTGFKCGCISDKYDRSKDRSICNDEVCSTISGASALTPTVSGSTMLVGVVAAIAATVGRP